jgi:hypothetical protein
MARPHWLCPMGGTTWIFSPCTVLWADDLAHGTARHGDTGRHGGVPCQHGTPVPRAVPARWPYIIRTIESTPKTK